MLHFHLLLNNEDELTLTSGEKKKINTTDKKIIFVLHSDLVTVRLHNKVLNSRDVGASKPPFTVNVTPDKYTNN